MSFWEEEDIVAPAKPKTRSTFWERDDIVGQHLPVTPPQDLAVTRRPEDVEVEPQFVEDPLAGARPAPPPTAPPLPEPVIEPTAERQPPVPGKPLPTGTGFAIAQGIKNTLAGTFVPMAKAGTGAIQAVGGLIDFIGQYEPLGLVQRMAGKTPLMSKFGKAIAQYGAESREILEGIRPSKAAIGKDETGKLSLIHI